MTGLETPNPLTPNPRAPSLRPRRFFRRRRRRQLETPFVGGNRVSVLVDGSAFFPALLEAIENAKSYVLIESYILASDETGQRVANALTRKAAEGVEVALSYDSFGSLGVLEDWFIESLQARGVLVFEFLPVSPFNVVASIQRRNHRKSLIVDGQIGIVGGLNISDDYASVEDGGKGWRDTAVRVEGPAVAQLEAFFRHNWRARGARPLRSLPLGCSPREGGVEVRFDTNEGRRDRAHVRRAYLAAIIGAQSTIRLTHAYFTPDAAIVRALKRAARRGVSVELITARATDVRASWHVARGLYGSLLSSGIRIHEWHERVLHAKTAVVDGSWVAIGSANLNRRSLRFDLEVNAFARTGSIGPEMDARFEADRARCEEVTLAAHRRRPRWVRFLEWFFGLLRPLF